MPEGDRQLAREDRGALLGAVLDDLEQVGCLVGAERSDEEVVDEEHLDARPARHEPGEAPVGSCDRELVEHPRCPQVERGVPPADRGVGECAGEEGLADPGRADDETTWSLCTQCDSASERTRGGRDRAALEVDVLDDGGACAAWRSSTALRGAGCRGPELAVDEQPEALFEARALRSRAARAVGEALGHRVQPEGSQPLDGALVSMCLLLSR